MDASPVEPTNLTNKLKADYQTDFEAKRKHLGELTVKMMLSLLNNPYEVISCHSDHCKHLGETDRVLIRISNTTTLKLEVNTEAEKTQ